MLRTWRAISAPGVGTSISSRSSARAVAPADELTARGSCGRHAPGCACSSCPRSSPRHCGSPEPKGVPSCPKSLPRPRTWESPGSAAWITEPERRRDIMSSSAQTGTPAKPSRGSVPLYKRRRRRIYGAAAAALAVVVAVVVWATTGRTTSAPAGTSAPTWPPTAGPGAGPGPAGWGRAPLAWSSSR